MGLKAQDPINNKDKEQNLYVAGSQPTISQNQEQHLICHKLVNIFIPMNQLFFLFSHHDDKGCPSSYLAEALCICWIQLPVYPISTENTCKNIRIDAISEKKNIIGKNANWQVSLFFPWPVLGISQLSYFSFFKGCCHSDITEPARLSQLFIIRD